MRIIVLAGGLSTERDVSLSSGAGICRTLREKGHDAFLLDPFLGLPDAGDNLEAAFTRPDAGLSLASGIRSTEPDLEAVKADAPYLFNEKEEKTKGTGFQAAYTKKKTTKENEIAQTFRKALRR